MHIIDAVDRLNDIKCLLRVISSASDGADPQDISRSIYWVGLEIESLCSELVKKVKLDD
ncbi:MAG: hypothetical protein OHK0012_04910 [Synechococcales cyanobacterium]